MYLLHRGFHRGFHRGYHRGYHRGFCRGFCRGLLRINLEGVCSMPTLIILVVIFYVIGGDHPL